MSKPVAVQWQESAEDLYARYTTETDVGSRQRLLALWLVRRGEKVQTAAETAGVGTRTVERWLGWYRQGGLEQVRERVLGHASPGAECLLSAEQLEELMVRSQRGEYRTYEEARRWVLSKWAVEYSWAGMYGVLARLSVHPKVPRPQAARANTAAQAEWKRGGSRSRCAVPEPSTQLRSVSPTS